MSDNWFSEFPSQIQSYQYSTLKSIDPDILAVMKMQGPIGYAPNPKTSLRNQVKFYDPNGIIQIANNTFDSCEILTFCSFFRFHISWTVVRMEHSHHWSQIGTKKMVSIAVQRKLYQSGKYSYSWKTKQKYSQFSICEQIN